MRASATFRSRFDWMALSTSEVSVGSLKAVHHWVRSPSVEDPPGVGVAPAHLLGRMDQAAESRGRRAAGHGHQTRQQHNAQNPHRLTRLVSNP